MYKRFLTLPKKRIKVLKLAKENGGLSPKDAREIYNSKSSAYETLNLLSEKGFLNKNKAPKTSKVRYIYMLSAKGERLIKLLF